MCYRLPWDPSRLQAIDQQIMAELGRQGKSQSALKQVSLAGFTMDALRA